MDIIEKWGELRVSLSVYTDALDERVEAAEEQAERTCIMCGGEARLFARHRGWVTNACSTCRSLSTTSSDNAV